MPTIPIPDPYAPNPNYQAPAQSYYSAVGSNQWAPGTGQQTALQAPVQPAGVSPKPIYDSSGQLVNAPQQPAQFQQPTMQTEGQYAGFATTSYDPTSLTPQHLQEQGYGQPGVYRPPTSAGYQATGYAQQTGTGAAPSMPTASYQSQSISASTSPSGSQAGGGQTYHLPGATGGTGYWTDQYGNVTQGPGAVQTGTIGGGGGGTQQQGYGGVSGQFLQEWQTSQDEARAANEERYADILGLLEGVGEQQGLDIEERYGKLSADIQQRMVSAGLSGTSAPWGPQAMAARESAAEKRRLAEDLAMMKAGVMERRTDSYPDAAQMAQMLQGYGGVVGAGGLDPTFWGTAGGGYGGSGANNAAARAAQRAQAYYNSLYGGGGYTGGTGAGSGAGGVGGTQPGGAGGTPGTGGPGGDIGGGTGTGGAGLPGDGTGPAGTYTSQGVAGAPLPEAWMMYWGKVTSELREGEKQAGAVEQDVYSSLMALGIDNRTAEALAKAFSSNPTIPNLIAIFNAQQTAPNAVG